MARRERRVRCTAAPRSEVVRLGEPVRWTVSVTNEEPTAVHVSHRIRSLDVDQAAGTIEVSTARPQLADTVTISLQDITTTPVPPNQSVDLDFELTFPMRLARFTGPRGSIEVEEWTPPGDVEIRMTVAYGDQPFYPPADERRMNDALAGWTMTVNLPPMRLRMQRPPEAPSRGAGPRTGE